ncbi:MAG: hypothetical protein IT522_00790 [Burkholderiales bacterium]|nr:hypothetical protein [Burkholderiales bacterium]
MRHRRCTSGFLLVAFVLATVLPMHVGALGAHRDRVGRDLCTAAGTKEAPAHPERARQSACATCFACGAAAALPAHPQLVPVVAGRWLPIAPPATLAAAIGHRHALARGPPLGA